MRSTIFGAPLVFWLASDIKPPEVALFISMDISISCTYPDIGYLDTLILLCIVFSQLTMNRFDTMRSNYIFMDT